MGFFSNTCPHCNDSIKAPYGLTEEAAWQNAMTVILADGTKHEGLYNGYGRCETGSDVVDLQETLSDAAWDVPDYAWFHTACYKAAGSPSVVVEPSKHATDQGYFYNHADVPREPRHTQESK